VKEKGSNKNVKTNYVDPGTGTAAVPTRPQKPKDAMGFGGGTFKPGTAPAGGFQAVWNFSGRPNDYKNSPVSKPEKGTI